MISIARTVIIVPDLDKALDFYSTALGFDVLFDQTFGPVRLLHVGPSIDSGLWLIKPQHKNHRARIGSQTADQPVAVLYSDDLDADLARFTEAGGTIARGPDGVDGARFAHVLDPWRTQFVLSERPS